MSIARNESTCRTPRPETLLDLFATCGRALADARNRLRVADGAIRASDPPKVRTELGAIDSLLAETLSALSEMIVAFNRQARFVALSREDGPVTTPKVKRPRRKRTKRPASTLYWDAQIGYAQELIDEIAPLAAERHAHRQLADLAGEPAREVSTVKLRATYFTRQHLGDLPVDVRDVATLEELPDLRPPRASLVVVDIETGGFVYYWHRGNAGTWPAQKVAQ